MFSVNNFRLFGYCSGIILLHIRQDHVEGRDHDETSPTGLSCASLITHGCTFFLKMDEILGSCLSCIVVATKG